MRRVSTGIASRKKSCATDTYGMAIVLVMPHTVFLDARQYTTELDVCLFAIHMPPPKDLTLERTDSHVF